MREGGCEPAVATCVSCLTTLVGVRRICAGRVAMREGAAGFPLVKALCVFFFQAEDGIRDYKVTGVQTCALPIWVMRTYLNSPPKQGVRQFGVVFPFKG